VDLQKSIENPVVGRYFLRTLPVAQGDSRISTIAPSHLTF
jgi:hypothetical protein